LEKFGGMTALGRPGQPAELAPIHVQLAAADASFATGQDDRHDTPAGRPAAVSTRPKISETHEIDPRRRGIRGLFARAGRLRRAIRKYSDDDLMIRWVARERLGKMPIDANMRTA
jgi:hypothetical protein